MVVKYLFQFGFFPWNSHVVLRRYENKPYFPPRILGLEKTDGYIKYDLVQLMALFFHRSQLLVSANPASAGLGRPSGHLRPLPGGKAPSPQPPAPQCYGLWDHEEDSPSKEHDKSGRKEQGAEEGPGALPEPQAKAGTGLEEEPGVPEATTEDHVQVEARVVPTDGTPEPQVELRPRDTRRISLRLRRRRKEGPARRGLAAIGISAPSHNLLPTQFSEWGYCREGPSQMRRPSPVQGPPGSQEGALEPQLLALPPGMPPTCRVTAGLVPHGCPRQETAPAVSLPVTLGASCVVCLSVGWGECQPLRVVRSQPQSPGGPGRSQLFPYRS